MLESFCGDRTAAGTAVFQTAHASSSLARRSSFEEKDRWLDAPFAQQEEHMFRNRKIGVRGVNGAPKEGASEEESIDELDAKTGSAVECLVRGASNYSSDAGAEACNERESHGGVSYE